MALPPLGYEFQEIIIETMQGEGSGQLAGFECLLRSPHLSFLYNTGGNENRRPTLKNCELMLFAGLEGENDYN